MIRICRDDVDESKASDLVRRFDYLMYSIKLGLLQGKNVNAPIDTVVTTAILLSANYTIPQVAAHKDTIQMVQ
ncbi:MAG: hypothetical protein MJ131_06995 [Lachnospiraceae bacterium]|nr:hypothetical protein [Lachnospiraceae bacterium]